MPSSLPPAAPVSLPRATRASLPPAPPRTALGRRGLLAAAGVVGLGAALAACGGGSSPRSASSAAGTGGAWSFTDDRGVKAKAAHRPRHVVAFVGTAAALHDYGVEVVGVFGPTVKKDGSPDVQAGDLDVRKVTVVGNVYGEFDVERYAALDPDLLATEQWQKGELWYVPDKAKSQIMALAPAVALEASQTTVPKALERHAALAASLGADLRAPRVTEAKAAFDKAAARLRAAARARPEITVLIGSASQDLFYVSLAKMSADTAYFQDLGVHFVTPDKLDPQGYFEDLSWENLATYPADIIMMDNRTSALQPADLTSRPTWARLPAVKAGQVIPRVTEPIFSYGKCAPILDDLAAAIEKAKKVS